jgi:hypothetical protein
MGRVVVIVSWMTIHLSPSYTHRSRLNTSNPVRMRLDI